MYVNNQIWSKYFWLIRVNILLIVKPNRHQS